MYIVFEGIDESGKTTQIELVKERLKLIFKQEHYATNIIQIAEPEIKYRIDGRDDIEMALRYALQRRLIHNKYPRQIFFDDNSTIVLSDRSFYSSLAYQYNICHHVDKNFIRTLNSFVHEPAMIFFLDKGESDDTVLNEIRNQYFKVLPLSAIHVDTKNHQLNSTTKYITKHILRKWKETIPNQYE